MAGTTFIDRTRELGALERAWDSADPHLILVTGRRRVGKSRLLGRFARGKHLSFIAATQRVRQIQLADAGRDVGALASGFRRGRHATIRLDDWDDLLRVFEDAGQEERVGIVIDEFPYLVAESPELPSLIQRWWDRLKGRSKVFLVLSGSHQSVMREIVGAHGPLFGRTTLRFDLQPLDYYEAGKFVPGWSPEDRIRAYAVVGGIPEYLRHLDDDHTLRWNIERLAFEPEGPLFREVDYLFDSEFREVSRRGSIFRAIARGSVRPNDIAHAIGLGGAADVIPNLRDLVELGLVERVVPITDRDVMRARHVIYRIADPYLRFYFSIVEPRRAEITVSRPAQVSEGLTNEAMDAFVSRAVEGIVRQYVWRRSATTRELTPQAVGTWWTADEEIDVVSMRERTLQLVGEVKWTTAVLDARDLTTLERRGRLIDPDGEPVRLLFSRAGFHRSVPIAPDIWRVRPSDLYAASLELHPGS